MKALFKMEVDVDLKQPVNQWISIVFIGCLTLLVVLYYFTHQAFAVGEKFAPPSIAETLDIHNLTD